MVHVCYAMRSLCQRIGQAGTTRNPNVHQGSFLIRIGVCTTRHRAFGMPKALLQAPAGIVNGHVDRIPLILRLAASVPLCLSWVRVSAKKRVCPITSLSRLSFRGASLTGLDSKGESDNQGPCPDSNSTIGLYELCTPASCFLCFRTNEIRVCIASSSCYRAVGSVFLGGSVTMNDYWSLLIRAGLQRRHWPLNGRKYAVTAAYHDRNR